MEWKDVPTPVIEQILDKWKSVLAHGEWINHKTWTACALCEFIVEWREENGERAHCANICPASNGDWCNEKGILSKLSMSYHADRDEEKTEEWLDAVEEFVNGLEKHLERRKKNETKTTNR